MQTVIKDLKYAFRGLIREPSFTAVALLSLALGIGANTTIFSVFNTIMLRPFPIEDAERLVMLNEIQPEQGRRRPSHSVFFEWRRQSQGFEDMARTGFRGGDPMTLSGAGKAERISVAPVTPNFFSVIGVSSVLGRTFDAEEVLPEGPVGGPDLVISHSFWQRYFGGDPDVIGQTVLLEGSKKTVIGVMPPGFWVFPWAKNTDAWLAFPLHREGEGRWLDPIARLKSGVSLEQAQAEMNTIAKRIEQNFPETNTGWGIQVEGLHEFAVGGYRRTLYLWMGAVGFVLLIACANVANLLLARGASRRREMALRGALGAGRCRLLKQLLTESLLLALLGGAAGFLLSFWGIRIFVALAPTWFARAQEVRLDSTVLVFTLAIALLAGVIFGLIPALRSSKLQLLQALQAGGSRSSERTGVLSLRGALVVAEVALALLLLIGAGLMARSFLRLQKVDPGFEPQNILKADIFLAGPKYWNPAEGDSKRVTPQVVHFFDQVVERAEALPGVRSVSTQGVLWPRAFRIIGQAPRPLRERPRAPFCEISPGFFRTLQVSLLKGRLLTDEDVNESPWVAVINESMERKFFPEGNALGQSLQLTIVSGGAAGTIDEDRPREIVGVVGNIRHWGPRGDPPPVIYSSFRQHVWEYPGGLYGSHLWKDLVIRTAGESGRMGQELPRIVAEVDPTQAVFDIQTADQELSDSVAFQRFWMSLFGILAALAVLLAAVGIFGIMSYSVRQRTHAIGVRMAVGAERRDVVRLVIWQGLKLTLLGLAIGLGASFWLTKLIARFLYGVDPTDPMTLALVSILLMVVAVAAAAIPARWASRVDPVVALRYE
jgi:putative ABC transport system permease protein